MNYKCKWCEYESKESEFLEGECPACCCDNETGEYNENSIPKVFHMPITKKISSEDSNIQSIPKVQKDFMIKGITK